MIDALARAEQLVREPPGAITLDQFRNPANPEIHRRTTAVEIWDDTGGAVDVVVSAFGTGGTFTGLGQTLQARKASLRVVVVEPAGAAGPSGQGPGEPPNPGIGGGFLGGGPDRPVVGQGLARSHADALAGARER